MSSQTRYHRIIDASAASLGAATKDTLPVWSWTKSDAVKCKDASIHTACGFSIQSVYSVLTIPFSLDGELEYPARVRLHTSSCHVSLSGTVNHKAVDGGRTRCGGRGRGVKSGDKKPQHQEIIRQFAHVKTGANLGIEGLDRYRHEAVRNRNLLLTESGALRQKTCVQARGLSGFFGT